MPTFTKIALTLATLLAINLPAGAQDAAPFRFLSIPIRGNIGIDVTSPGVQQAIDLAKNEKMDGIVLTFDAEIGDLDVGRAIAKQISAAGDDLRTIAILRQSGGPALPIIFACRDWLVLNSQNPDDISSRVMVAGLGESRPTDTNRTHAGMAENRRVEFVVHSLDEGSGIPLFKALEEVDELPWVTPTLDE